MYILVYIDKENNRENAACKAGSSKMENVDDRMVTASWDYAEFVGD